MSTGNHNHSTMISERLRNHKLSLPTFEQASDVVRWFGAVQAQEFQAAKWALALRMRHSTNATNAAVEAAFNRGEIVRTHLLRPTWHFVAPEDLRWLLQLTGPRVNQRCSSTYRKYELDSAVLKRSNRVLAKALKGGKQLTRSELKAVLNRAGVAADDTVRMAHILLRAELDGVVCSGPRRGNQFTYALVEERVPAGKQFDRDEALAELARRYFSSHGPATIADFVWWSGLTVKDARRVIELLDREIEKIQLGETVYLTANTGRRSSNSMKRDDEAHLLPAYDEYNVAYKHRQLVFDRNAVSQITAWGALGPNVIVDGRIVGLWNGTIVRNSVEIEITPARPLTRRERSAITKAAERYAAFLGVPLAATHIQEHGFKKT
ncbi:MAG TPA: winged helix DNA-binding domain-containing protein [Pyrinomonadaceae bacterium]|nr:winged helix DNA-binding domain-containing protein [Pyrinomonadaceae bacterium]